MSISSPIRRLATLKPIQWGTVFVASAVFLTVLETLHLPAALLLGPMIGAILIASLGANLHVPSPVQAFAQAIVGMMISRSLPLSNLHEAAQQWQVFVAGTSATVIAAGAMGWILSQRRVLPGSTAIWGSSPGAASTMIVMSESFGADMRLVAFLQYLRVMGVAAVASIIASLVMAGGGHPIAPVEWFPHLDATQFALTMAVAIGGAVIGRVSKMPAGALMIPMILSNILANLGFITIVLPPWLLAISYGLFGWSIGLRFTRAILIYAARAFPKLVVAVATLIGVCAGFGMVLSAVAGVDPLTAYLATSPGGADSVAIIAASSNVDVPFVMTMQMMRFLTVLVTGPALARYLAVRA